MIQSSTKAKVGELHYEVKLGMEDPKKAKIHLAFIHLKRETGGIKKGAKRGFKVATL